MNESESDGEALELFENIENKAEEEVSPEVERQGERKRLKKHKKDKKKKKKRHIEYDEEEEEEDEAGGVRAYIEEEASEDSDE
jgi:hypothetical protein